MKKKMYRQAPEPRVRQAMKFPKIHMVFKISLPVGFVLAGLLLWYTNTLSSSVYVNEAEKIFVVSTSTNPFFTWAALWMWLIVLVLTIIALFVLFLAVIDTYFWHQVSAGFFAVLAAGAILVAVFSAVSLHYQNTHNPYQPNSVETLTNEGITIHDETPAEAALLGESMVKVTSTVEGLPSGLYGASSRAYDGVYVFVFKDDDMIAQSLRESVSGFNVSEDDETEDSGDAESSDE